MNLSFPDPYLKKWFLESKRDFPWRDNPTPYAVWVSEMMLQQTQASVVVSYFLRWMERFPTIEALASAELEEVMKMWEGLGYYVRARNLHKGAQKVVREYGGKFPKEKETLAMIPGLGPYTIGAIQSFGFHQKKAAVDGNVMRVLTRFFGIDSDIMKMQTRKELWQYAEDILPDKEPWIINEALIELGALVCRKKARCHACPLQEQCHAFAEGKVDALPFSTKKIQIEKLFRTAAVVLVERDVLIRKIEEGEIMSHLYEFPYFTHAATVTLQQRKEEVHKWLGQTPIFHKKLPPVKHSFTRYRVALQPLLFSLSTKQEIPDYQWIPLEETHRLPFSSGHRRILSAVHDSFPKA